MKLTKLIALFIVILFLTGCSLETKTLPEFYEKDLAAVNKIIIFDGNTGYQKTITDNDVIEDFLSEIAGIEFIPDENQDARDGMNYSIALFQDGEETFQFGLTYVNDHYYHTAPDIYPIIEGFYTNLDVEEK